jgi:peptide/nickel transport system substrate-binding protein
MRKTLAFAAVALVVASGSLALAAPKKMPSYRNVGVTAGKAGGSYTLMLGDAPPSFMYYGAIDANAQTVLGQMFDGLIEYNLGTMAVEPALAESWTTSSDGKVWTFKLRQGVKWHDGTEFTADDVIFTYSQIVTNPEARGGDVGEFTLGGVLTKFEKVDKYTVRFVLGAANGPFLQKLRKPILPKHKLVKFTVEGGGKAADINNAWATNTDPKEIVGTGPFKLQAYVAGQKVTLAKNADFWKVDSQGKDLPYLNSLEFLVVKGSDAQAAQFLAGNVDSYNISAPQFPDFKSKEVAGANFKVFRNETFINSVPHWAFNFNAGNAELSTIFSDVRFRTAMQSALNRARIIDTVYNGLATLPGHGVARPSAFYLDTVKYLGSYSLKDADERLDAMGLMDKDGVRMTKSGKQLEFTLTYGSDSAVWSGIAPILQDDLKKLGIKVNLKGVASSTLLATGRGKDWESIMVAFGNQPDPDLRKPIWQPGGALYYWHQATQGADGKPVTKAMQSWEKRLVEVWDQGSITVDPQKRRILYNEWQVSTAKNLPVIMIAQPPNLAAVRNTIGNFVFTTYVIPGHNPIPLIFNK